MTVLKLYTDGAARGNPGPAASGVVLVNEQGSVLHEEGKLLGETTNNVAEYMAILLGLEQAHILGASAVECFSDSQLVIKQLTGEYKIKQPHLQEIHAKIKKQEQHFDSIIYNWVKRNTSHVERADQLCNLALDGAL